MPVPRRLALPGWQAGSDSDSECPGPVLVVRVPTTGARASPERDWCRRYGTMDGHVTVRVSLARPGHLKAAARAVTVAAAAASAIVMVAAG